MNIAIHLHHHSHFFSSTLQKPQNSKKTQNLTAKTRVIISSSSSSRRRRKRKLSLKGCADGDAENKADERRSFLSLEEAGLVEISGLSSHEKFLCRLTISSLNLLRVISEQEGFAIEELNAGRICDWFLKDKLKREQNVESAVLQWDDPDFPF